MPRSALVPAECPIDFSDLDSFGGRLLVVHGPPIYPTWSAEYSCPPSSNLCPFCAKLVEQWKGSGDPEVRVVVLIEGEAFYAHVACTVTQLGRRTKTQGHHGKTEWDDAEKVA